MSAPAIPPRAKAGYHHGDLREALLGAADRILHEEGLQGLTLRACARRAGVSHAAPKHHFASLADLLSAVAARGFEYLAHALQEARARAGDDPAERFVAAARTYVGYARSHPSHFRLMFRSDSLEGNDDALRAARAHAFAELADIITLQRGEPDVVPGTLRERFTDEGLVEDILLGWSYVHGYAQLLLEGQIAAFAQEEDADAFIDRSITATGERMSRMMRERPDADQGPR